ncbi:MAG: bifunctional diaminohydroxyphosphoribosylaminopyrimidine deaminase/5-amino-6-(5-phosphoribosylamino)uracil reductase RibD [Pseudomonadota bacterium]
MSAFSAADRQFMAIALQQAEQGRYTTDPNPCVGAVLVKNQTIIGTGYHQRAGEPHAERHALSAAGKQAQGSTLYVTLEPCCHQGRTPPCTQALIAAGVQDVVVAMQDPNPQVAGQGIATLRAAGITTRVGLLETEARALNPGFIQRMKLGKPLIRLKLAMSLDGRTATANGESQWITSSAARADVQRLRAASSAILTGIGTVLTDDPALTVRPDELNDIPTDHHRQPLRIVLDSQARMPTQAQMLRLPGQTLIVTGPIIPTERRQALQTAGADIISLPLSDNCLSLPHLIPHLTERELNTILIECGPTLAGSVLQAGIVDELIVYLAPCLLGDQARGLVTLPGLQQLAQRLSLQLVETQPIGPDLRLTLHPQPATPTS